MAKSKRVGRAAPQRGVAPSRPRVAADLPSGADLPKRGAPRDRTVQAMEEPRDDGPDAWLAPDEDDAADLDQWLHDHGMDSGEDGPSN